MRRRSIQSKTWVGKYVKRDFNFSKKINSQAGHYLAVQCDQMVRLLIQYWAIYSNEHLVQYHKNGQSRFTKVAQYFKMLTKMAKFRQIWSHCLARVPISFVVPILHSKSCIKVLKLDYSKRPCHKLRSMHSAKSTVLPSVFQYKWKSTWIFSYSVLFLLMKKYMTFFIFCSVFNLTFFRERK